MSKDLLSDSYLKFLETLKQRVSMHHSPAIKVIVQARHYGTFFFDGSEILGFAESEALLTGVKPILAILGIGGIEL